jgi:cobalt-zinc-cadmium efflux system membrane fusion protein
MRYAAFLVLLIFLVAGCTQKQKTAETHEGETIKKTVWTSRTELFMEYDEPKAGSSAGFLVHLTDLGNFKPVTEGSLTLTFTPEAGEPVTVKIDAPEKPGIYKADATFTRSGEYTLSADLSGKALSDRISVPAIKVLGDKEKHGEGGHAEKGGSQIVFLKEQQWTVEFMVAQPAKRQVSSSFVATGELIPATNSEVTVSSPLSGIMSVSSPIPHPGKRVSKGDVVAVIEPPVSQQGGLGQLTASYAETKNRVILAQKEYERAKHLHEAKAAPKRRLEEAELSLESAKAALDPLERAVQNMKGGAAENKVVIRAPISGSVVELLTSNGKAVEAGQPLMRIINAVTLWLRANVPATEIGGLRNLDKATFTISGMEGEIKPSRLVTVNDVVDPKTRTVPVIFEVNNGKGQLKAGMFADVSIKTGHAENALTLPDEALFEDEGRFFVFVQTEGESFERREVKVGVRGNGYAQIKSGVRDDDHVVTRGGYYVKLASLSSRMPEAHAGHGH